MGKPISLSAPAQTVRDGNHDRFLESLFVPAEPREALFALYAFETELAHVHHMVTEELNAHIRYAWWQESLDGIHGGQIPRAHPTVQALAPLMQQGLIGYDTLSAMVASYREVFPDMPKDVKLADNAARELIRKICPQAEEGWSRAQAIIVKHRNRHGHRWNMLLHLKLMRLGVF